MMQPYGAQLSRRAHAVRERGLPRHLVQNWPSQSVLDRILTTIFLPSFFSILPERGVEKHAELDGLNAEQVHKKFQELLS